MTTIKGLKISIIDTIFPVGHQLLNNKLLSLFPENYDVLVLNKQNYFKTDQRKSVKWMSVRLFGNRKRYIFTFFLQIINYLYIRLKLFSRKDDVRFFFTFDTAAFGCVWYLFKDSRNLLIHHNNTDHLSSKKFRYFFNCYKNKVEHIVFADFIKNRLVELGVDEKRIVVMAHPIPDTEGLQNSIVQSTQKLFISLGYASDEQLFKQLIEFEETSGVLKQNNIQFVLRAQSFTYESDSIVVLRGHLPKDTYESLFEKAKGVILLYPVSYQYRYSGSVLDALRHGKLIIGSDIPVVNHFMKLYPAFCVSVKSVNELVSIILKSTDVPFNHAEHARFFAAHADNQVKQDIEHIINA